MMVIRCDVRDGKSGSGRLLLSCLLAAGSLVLIAAMARLSTSPVHSYFRVSGPTGHVAKTGKTSEPGIEGAEDIPVSDHVSRLESPDPVGVILPRLALLFPILPQLLRANHFRPPPLS